MYMYMNVCMYICVCECVVIQIQALTLCMCSYTLISTCIYMRMHYSDILAKKTCMKIFDRDIQPSICVYIQ